MKNGYKIIDMDTHFGPSTTVMYEYVDPSFRPRLPEMDVYRGTGQVRDRLRNRHPPLYPVPRHGAIWGGNQSDARRPYRQRGAWENVRGPNVWEFRGRRPSQDPSTT